MSNTVIATPNIVSAPSVLQIPTDGSNYGAQVNAFIAWNLNHTPRCTEHILTEGCMTAEVPIVPPAPGCVKGSGTPDTYNTSQWLGGTQIRQQQAQPGVPSPSVIASIGTNSGNSLAGMRSTVWLENLHVVGQCGSTSTLTAGAGNGRLFDLQYCYRPKLRRCGAVGWGVGHFRFINCWDWDMEQCSTFGGGFRDPLAASTIQYTGRAQQPIERLFGMVGVPAIEIGSTPGGPMNTNNGRISGLHAENTPLNACLVFLWGPNGNGIHFNGFKCEGGEGSTPLIIADDQDGLMLNFTNLVGGGNGTNPAAFGNMPAGQPWKGFKSPGLILANNCRHLVVNSALTSIVGSKATCAPRNALVYLNQCVNPQVNLGVGSGLDVLTEARIVSIGGIADDMLRAKSYPYIDAVPGAMTQEVYRHA